MKKEVTTRRPTSAPKLKGKSAGAKTKPVEPGIAAAKTRAAGARTVARKTAGVPEGAGGNGAALDSARVAEVAYTLYLESGQQHGRDQEHWYEAEARLLGGL